MATSWAVVRILCTQWWLQSMPSPWVTKRFIYSGSAWFWPDVNPSVTRPSSSPSLRSKQMKPSEACVAMNYESMSVVSKKRNCQRLYASHFLRNRPWVYCDQITGQCRDAISKKDWLDPSKRLPQCVQSVVKGETSENAPIQFCLLDDSRTELCNKVVQWNL